MSMSILLVDDHPSMLIGMRSQLEQEPGISEIHEAQDVYTAVNLAKVILPDVVVLDLNFRNELDGIEACRELKEIGNRCRVLIHSAHDSYQEIALASMAGADGYLHKGVGHISLFEAIKQVHDGEAVWAVRLGSASPSRSPLSAVDKALTAREAEVYALLMKRYSNAEIAGHLGNSINTVKNQVRSILRKLEVTSRKNLYK